MLKIGSHVGLKAPDMFLGSVQEALNYDANAMMIYTGAPQNTRRKPIEELKIDEAHELLKAHSIPLENVVVHAPYIINLGNTIKPETFELAVEFLEKEIQRTEAIGAKYLVLHPGAHVGAGIDAGLASIVAGLNQALTKTQETIVCLETMAGKGTECGSKFEELKYIIDNVEFSDKLAVCLDTCHISDAGYDLNNFESVLKEFDEVIGLDRLKVIHVNDSKNEINSHKDRHENIGYGHIGFDVLSNIVNHERLTEVVKVLETPYIKVEGEDSFAPYKKEIEMLRNKKFDNWLNKEN